MKISHVIESVDSKVAPVSAPLKIQPTRTQLKQHVHVAPEKKTPAVVNHIKSKDVKEGWGGALVGAIGGGMIGGPVGAAVGGAAGYALGGGDDSPEEAYELGQQMARDGYSEEDNPYEEGWTGPSDAMQAWHDGWTDARSEYKDDEDDPPQAPPIKQLSAPVAVPTKTVVPPKTSGPADFSKRGFTGYKKPGDMEEGVRVPAQQILGTKNRAKSAYYPTNVKPKVPKLDKPLTDQELARLAQLAGIKSK